MIILLCIKCIVFCKFIGGETTHHRCLVYAANRNGKVIKVKIATGKVIKTYSGLTGPFDVAVAPDGKLWVVDFKGNSIRIYHEEN